MIINRSSLEQRMNSFHGFVEELEISLERLRKIAQELETHYEVEALGGRWDRGKAGNDIGKLTKSDRWKSDPARGPVAAGVEESLGGIR